VKRFRWVTELSLWVGLGVLRMHVSTEGVAWGKDIVHRAA
jgi:hypothetical protein